MNLPEQRRRLSRLLVKLVSTIESLDLRRSQLRASVYRHRIRCGKPGCHCAKGSGHLRSCLSFGSDRGRHTRTLSDEQERELAPGAEAYQRYRKTRAEAARQWRQILVLIESIQGKLVRRLPAEYRKRKR